MTIPNHDTRLLPPDVGDPYPCRCGHDRDQHYPCRDCVEEGHTDCDACEKCDCDTYTEYGPDEAAEDYRWDKADRAYSEAKESGPWDD